MKGTCLIVGGGLGMGLGLANEFASHHYSIGFITRRQSIADQVGKAILEKNDVTFEGIENDISDFKALEFSIMQFINKHGVPSVVIYNAAGYGNGNAMQQDPEGFMNDLRVSAGGFLTTYQSVYPLMVKKGGGSVLATGGGITNKPSFDYLSLGMGKTAIDYIVKSIAPNFAENNIHAAIVNIYGPIKEGTFFSPENIAKAFWVLHLQEKNEFSIVYDFKQ